MGIIILSVKLQNKKILLYYSLQIMTIDYLIQSLMSSGFSKRKLLSFKQIM